MLTLNYAPEELKKEAKLRRTYNIIKMINYVLVFVVLILSIAFYSTRLILQNSFNKIVEETSLITKNSQGYNNEVKQINQKIKDISEIQQSFIYSSKLIETIASNTPDGVTLSSLKLDAASNKVYLVGKSNNRDNLLKFKQNLENIEILSEIKFPINNLIEKTNINFNIEAIVKPDSLN